MPDQTKDETRNPGRLAMAGGSRCARGSLLGELFFWGAAEGRFGGSTLGGLLGEGITDFGLGGRCPSSVKPILFVNTTTLETACAVIHSLG